MILLWLFKVLTQPKVWKPLKGRDCAFSISVSQHLALFPLPSTKNRDCIQQCLFTEWVNPSWGYGNWREEFQCVSKLSNSWHMRPPPLPWLFRTTLVSSQAITPQLWGTFRRVMLGGQCIPNVFCNMNRMWASRRSRNRRMRKENGTENGGTQGDNRIPCWLRWYRVCKRPRFDP